MEQSQSPSSLAHRIRSDADVAHVADAIVSCLREIEAVLRPVIGQGGFDALFTRALHLTSLVHPWLARARDLGETPVSLIALRPVLAQRSSAQAAAGGTALLQTINDLLTSLIGASLTEELLGSVGLDAITLRGAAAQDTQS